MRQAVAYHFGSPVGPDHFCDRLRELERLVARATAGLNVILHAPRRYGKTSLLQQAAVEARTAGVAVAYVNLFRCSTRREVAESVVRGVFDGPLARRATAHRLARLAERIRVRPTIGVRPDGSFNVSFEPRLVEEDWPGVMADACRLAAEATTRPVAVILDEFQQAYEIDRALPGVFKALLDETGGMSWILAGSHTHLMERLTAAPGAPLLNMGDPMYLGAIPEPDMIAYLRGRAEAVGAAMAPVAARAICDLAGPAPDDIQRLAQHALELARTDIDRAVVDAALELVVDRQAATFAERYERLGGTAQRLLRAMAARPVERPYARSMLESIEVANDNAVRKALAALADHDLVRHRGGAWHVANPYFRRWLAHLD